MLSSGSEVGNTRPRTGNFHESLFGRFVNDKSGATAMEYAFIAVLIAVVLVTALRAVGTELMSTFTGISAELKNAKQP